MVVEKIKEMNSQANKERFLRFQFTALMATCVDFLVTILLKENLTTNYSLAVAGGASSGACAAFIINRYWVFKSFEKNPISQAIRYILVALGSIVLNTAGTYLLTESAHSPYLVSKAIIALILGLTYSYYFSKRFVFYA